MSVRLHFSKARSKQVLAQLPEDGEAPSSGGDLLRHQQLGILSNFAYQSVLLTFALFEAPAPMVGPERFSSP
jgi:hypothetical protein